MPSKDWARQQWVHLCRRVLNAKPPTRRGGMRKSRHCVETLSVRGAVEAFGIPEAPTQEYVDFVIADIWLSESNEDVQS